jgi:hypothetical protein
VLGIFITNEELLETETLSQHELVAVAETVVVVADEFSSLGEHTDASISEVLLGADPANGGLLEVAVQPLPGLVVLNGKPTVPIPSLHSDPPPCLPSTAAVGHSPKSHHY